MWAFQGYLGYGLGPIFDPQPAILPSVPHVAASYSFCHQPTKKSYHHQLTPPGAEMISLNCPWCGLSIDIVSAPGEVG